MQESRRHESPARTVSIGGACGFWGESAGATAQLLRGGVDYLVYDYLAEITMSILARARDRDPSLGYATDFVSAVLKPNLTGIARRGVKLVSNAGGVNPASCAAAACRLIDEAGVDLHVAVVGGDDLLPRAAELTKAGITEMFSGDAFPPRESLASVNAYLGAFEIAAALDAGADIVLTGRVVDSALTLGICIHEFGWAADDFDALAGGSLAGHIIECGPQATGGNFTDWELAAADYENIGYPIAEVAADGSFTCTKPAATGGLVTPHTVGEQLLYEIGDPQAYLLPDVTCDFSGVRLEQQGEDRVHVRNARGYPPAISYKVSATWADGFRAGQVLFFCGFEADRKARRFAGAALARARTRLELAGLPDFTETCVELIGDDSHYGNRGAQRPVREVAVKIAARHGDVRALGVLLQEITGLALGGPPGLTGFAGGRPKPSPVVRLFSFTWPKDDVPTRIDLDGRQWSPERRATPVQSDPVAVERPQPPAAPKPQGEMVDVPLVWLAIGRSGDKGDKANIGIIARRPDFLPWIWAALTEEAVTGAFAHFLDRRCENPVERFYLPGPGAINFLLHGALGGGGIASLRNDPQGKVFAQVLLDHPVAVPRALLEVS